MYYFYLFIFLHLKINKETTIKKDIKILYFIFVIWKQGCHIGGFVVHSNIYPISRKKFAKKETSFFQLSDPKKIAQAARRQQKRQQQQRLRRAQEIQRRLEEIDVKQKELEERGVLVEKALRGEGIGNYIFDY